MEHNEIKLITPTMELEKDFRDYVSEWNATGEIYVPFVIGFDISDFGEYVEKLLNLSKGIGLPDGAVPHSTFWLVKNGRILGVSNLRHRLNDKLRNDGGNIGYGVRPSERRKGYASMLLSKTLEKAKEFGLTEVLITCSSTNLGSIGTIKNNNGVFEKEVKHAAATVRYYWIKLT
jgi:predicted acetyltransferase